jgi:hypothetical protein
MLAVRQRNPVAACVTHVVDFPPIRKVVSNLATCDTSWRVPLPQFAEALHIVDSTRVQNSVKAANITGNDFFPRGKRPESMTESNVLPRLERSSTSHTRNFALNPRCAAFALALSIASGERTIDTHKFDTGERVGFMSKHHRPLTSVTVPIY